MDHQQAARKYAFGHERQAGRRSGNIFEPYLIADTFAYPFAEFLDTRRAAIRAAIRRGSSTRISPCNADSSAGGTRVVFPAPGGASKTRLREAVKARTYRAKHCQWEEQKAFT